MKGRMGEKGDLGLMGRPGNDGDRGRVGPKGRKGDRGDEGKSCCVAPSYVYSIMSGTIAHRSKRLQRRQRSAGRHWYER